MMENTLGDLHLGKHTHKNADGTVYKPRSARTERAWKAFLHGLESEGLRHLPGTVRVVRESDNGHTEEFVPNLETSEERLPEYYRCCGCLLCLTWLLRSCDLHEENLIASPDRPVLVDLETLLSGAAERETDLHDSTLAGSVTATHLLPGFDGFDDDSGFSGVHGQNRPVVDGGPVRIVDYMPQLLEGFEESSVNKR